MENPSKSLSTRRFNGNKVWPLIFCIPFLASYATFNLFPTIYSFYLSLFDWNGIGKKIFVGLGNYIELITDDPLFYKALGNTVIIMTMCIPVQIFLGLILAACIYNMRRIKTLLQSLLFLPYIVAPVAIGFIFSYMFDWQHGYINQILMALGVINEKIYWLQTPHLAKIIVALMSIWRQTGYCMVILVAGMAGIPEEVYDACKVDGAGVVTTFFRVTIPLLRNIIMFLVITSIISGLQMFDEPSMLYKSAGMGAQYIGGPEYTALTVIWKFYDNTFKTTMRMGYGASITYTLFVIIVALSLVSFKLGRMREES